MMRTDFGETIRLREHGRATNKKVRAFCVAAMVALLFGLLLLTAQPAYAKTFTVTNTADPGDGDCDASGCTLREAIDDANDTPGKDTITFNIQGGGGVKTIKPNSELPTIEDAVTINGYTQPGASLNTSAIGTNAVLKIELNGENAEPEASASGLFIRASDSVVRGLVINRFGGIGLQIGGPGADAQDNRVLGNFIGTDATGTEDLGNGGRGVVIFREGTSANTVGSDRPGARNLISGNNAGGLGIFSSAADNAIKGNLIGTKKDGTSVLANSVGSGVHLAGGASDNIVGGDSAVGGSNTIAFNNSDGITVEDEESTGNSILRNSIFSNGGLGIDLVGGSEIGFGTTANDEDDPDSGPNNLQNKPTLTSAKTGGGSTTIEGTLNSTPSETFVIRFFSNPPTGGAEGKKFIGQKSVSTNQNGNDTFTFSPAQKVPEGHSITATATDPDGNTSEFSTAQVVV
jgi:CSLREA domain-containing protein